MRVTTKLSWPPCLTPGSMLLELTDFWTPVSTSNPKPDPSLLRVHFPCLKLLKASLTSKEQSEEDTECLSCFHIPHEQLPSTFSSRLHFLHSFFCQLSVNASLVAIHIYLLRLSSTWTLAFWPKAHLHTWMMFPGFPWATRFSFLLMSELFQVFHSSKTPGAFVPFPIYCNMPH